MRVPRIKGFDKQSRPPVEEMTSRLPVTQSPLWNRSTAGVYSVARTRGARPVSGGGGLVICLRGSIVLIPDCVGDNERVYRARLPSGQGLAGELQEGPFNIYLLRMSARSLGKLEISSSMRWPSVCWCICLITPTILRGGYSAPSRSAMLDGTALWILPAMFRREPDLEDSWPQFSSDKQALSNGIVSDAV